MKIMIAEVGQETNTFSPDRIGFEKLAPQGWSLGSRVREEYGNTGTYLGGALKAADVHGVEVVGLDSFEVNGGAPMNTECLDYVVGHLCDQIKANLRECDGMFLAMHGGGGALGVEDLEIYMLRRIRKLTGRAFPIMSSLDMHSNLSQELVELSDGLFPIKEFPHSDMAVAGELATEQLIAAIVSGKKPVMTLVNLPIILPNTTTCTLLSPMKEVKEHFAEYGESHGFIDCSLVQDYSANDQYWAGVSVLITAAEKQEAAATELAQWFWERRRSFDPNSLGAEEAVEKAAAYKGEGFAVINESSDNPGSGCPGDGTHLLRALLKKNVPGSVFAVIYDEASALTCYNAGVGAKVDLHLGGHTTSLCGDPVEIKGARVLAVSDGDFRFTGAWKTGAATSIGKCARILVGNVEIVVCSICSQTFDNGPLVTTGTDVDAYKIIAIKSANHFRGFYQPRAGLIIPCETPGLRSTDLTKYPYKNIRRPIYPLDKTVTFLGK